MLLMPPLIADSAAFLLLLLPLIAVSFAFFSEVGSFLCAIPGNVSYLKTPEALGSFRSVPFSAFAAFAFVESFSTTFAFSFSFDECV